MQPNRPMLDPRMSHRRPVVSTAELDRRAGIEPPVQPQQALQPAVYGAEANIGGLSSRPARPRNARGTRFLAIVAVVVVAAAVGLYLVTKFGIGGHGGTKDGPADTSSGGTSADVERKADVNTLASAVELYGIDNNGTYPTFDELNDATWRSANMPKIQNDTLTDPENDFPFLTKSATVNSYAYVVGSAATISKSCDNQAILCGQFELITVLSDGTRYSAH